MELYDAIFYRKTIKNYSNKNINKHLMDKVREICSDITYLNKELKIKAHVIERGHLVHFLMEKKNRVKSPHYIAITCNEGEDYLQNIGFAAEKIILQLTSLGLGTCLLDCNLEMKYIEEFNHVEEDEKNYGKLVDLENEKNIEESKENENKEKPQVIIALGYPDDTERLFNQVDKTINRKKIKQVSRSMDKKWDNILNAMTLAPSLEDVQSWKVYGKDRSIDIYEQKQKKSLNKSSKISMGIALCHFDIGCKQENISVEYRKLDVGKKLGKSYYISVVENS